MKNIQNINGILLNLWKAALSNGRWKSLHSWSFRNLETLELLRYPDIVIQSLRRSWNFTRRREIIS